MRVLIARAAQALETKVFATFDRDSDDQLSLDEFSAASTHHPDLLRIAQDALSSPHGLVFPSLSVPLPPPAVLAARGRPPAAAAAAAAGAGAVLPMHVQDAEAAGPAS
jgi:hypothetical protein